MTDIIIAMDERETYFWQVGISASDELPEPYLTQPPAVAAAAAAAAVSTATLGGWGLRNEDELRQGLAFTYRFGGGLALALVVRN